MDLRQPVAGSRPLTATSASMVYRRVEVDGAVVFYREAGPPQAPTIVLLHGFPSSSRMFEPLIPLLAGRYHVIAPDYPGFGHSEAPPASAYEYSFDRLARTMGVLLDRLGVQRCTFFLQDYGGPVGFRVMEASPARVAGLVIQNANAYREGLGPKWEGLARYWSDPGSNEGELEAFLSLESARLRHMAGTLNPDRYSPDSWTDEYAMLSRRGSRDIHAALLFDYRKNLLLYPRWQAWLRTRQPPTLVLWGRQDPSFTVAGALAYLRDLPQARVHLLAAGHFVFDERLDEAANLLIDFLERSDIQCR